MLIGLGMLSISPAFAANVTPVSPANASHTAAVGTNVTATLSCLTGACLCVEVRLSFCQAPTMTQWRQIINPLRLP